MVKFDLRTVRSHIDLANGRIVLLNFPNSEIDVMRNIFRLGEKGDVVWQVRTDFDDKRNGPFTKIKYENGKLTASRWDGLLYEVNLETGFGVAVAETR